MTTDSDRGAPRRSCSAARSSRSSRASTSATRRFINLYERMGERARPRPTTARSPRSKTSDRQQRRSARTSSANAARAMRHADQDPACCVRPATSTTRTELSCRRGQIARQINGYEIQVTELLLSGALEDCRRPTRSRPSCSSRVVHAGRVAARSSTGRATRTQRTRRGSSCDARTQADPGASSRSNWPAAASDDTIKEPRLLELSIPRSSPGAQGLFDARRTRERLAGTAPGATSCARCAWRSR